MLSGLSIFFGMSAKSKNELGRYLKSRRGRLDPLALGFAPGRRRAQGLRREEVALRANVSPTWYTWLEQGRGGTPSIEALDRIAGALQLASAEREHLFLLAQPRPAEPFYEPVNRATDRLRKLLDTLENSPAYIKTAASDLVAWNRAAVAVMADYGRLAPAERNLLRLIFLGEHVRAKMPNWEEDARFAVATFRLEATRAAAGERAGQVVDDLCRDSADFRRIWADNDVSAYGEGVKHIVHPIAGPLALEYSAFSVDGQPDLGLVVYTPATQSDIRRVRDLIASGCDGWGRPLAAAG